MADQPETNPPPQTSPPAEPPPPEPPKPPPTPQPSGDTPGWVQGLVDAVGAIPEKVAQAVKEQNPPPAPEPKTRQQHEDAGNKILEDAGKPPAKAGSPAAGSRNRRRTFAEWWMGT